MVLSWRASAYLEGSNFLFLKLYQKIHKVSFQVKAILASFAYSPDIDNFVE